MFSIRLFTILNLSYRIIAVLAWLEQVRFTRKEFYKVNTFWVKPFKICPDNSKSLSYYIHNLLLTIVCIGVSTPPSSPQKHYSPLSCQPPPSPLNLKTVQVPLFSQSPPLYQFLVKPPLKVGFFSECPKC